MSQAANDGSDTPPLMCRDYLDQALKALELSMDHMQLFRQDKSHMPDETTSGQAVLALDQLLDALAGSQQVPRFLSSHYRLQQLDLFQILQLYRGFHHNKAYRLARSSYG